MSLLGFIYLIFVSLLIALSFAYVLQFKGPWNNFWAFFAILFFSVWAADLWIAPIGPIWNDIYWLRPLAAGLFIAMLLAAADPNPRIRSRIERQKVNRTANEQAVAIAIGTFFWVAMAIIITLVVSGVLFNYNVSS